MPRQDLAGEPELTVAAALRYLGRREYSAAELRQRLANRGATAADIESTLEYVRERGYQNDARAGECHIRRRIQYTPRGRALVRQELMELGITSELCTALMDEHYPPELEQELLRRLLAKESLAEAQEFETFATQKRRLLRDKLARRMLAKGFRQSLVIEMLQEWLPVDL